MVTSLPHSGRGSEAEGDGSPKRHTSDTVWPWLGCVSPFFFEDHRDSASLGEGVFGDTSSVFLGRKIRD